MSSCFQCFRLYFWPPERPIHLHECFLVSKKFLVNLRMFLFLFSFGIYTQTNINRGSFYKNYMYLTYWGEVLTMLTFFTLLVDNILHLQGFYKEYKNEESHLSRAAHVLFELAFSFELSIVLMYWLAVYPVQTDERNSFYYTTNILVHGMCLFCLWVDNIFNYIEFFPRHIIVLIIFAIAYSIDNAIVVFCINFDTVYTVLKWTDVASYFYVIGCIIVAILHFGLGYYIFRRKFKKWGHLIKNYMATPNSPGSFEMEKENFHH